MQLSLSGLLAALMLLTAGAQRTDAQNTGIPATDNRFVKHVLTNDFISEGVAIADVNRDGKPDILAGAYWFEAPDWVRHALAEGKHYDPATQFSNSFLDYSMDVNQDGWPDLIRISLPGEEAVWYENPGKKPGYWPMHPLLTNCGNESPAFVDVDGDGRPDLLCNDPVAKEVIWLKSPVKKGDTTWKRYVIAGGESAQGTNRYTHGLGLIDMNKDGRKDVVITKGWWERPANATKTGWVFHPAGLGEDCSQIYAVDARGDGKLGLVSSSAHRYGIWWHEKTDTGWVHHPIFSGVSETHALALADVNGDGHPDLVTGKRYFAHNGEDPGAYEPSRLYWFEFHPGAVPMWTPHLVDDNSGVGLQVLVQDLDGNGLPDIIVANKKGVFFFEQVAQGKRARELGLTIGVLSPGQWDAITDVPGVMVGQTTLNAGDSVHTGVTAILPYEGNIFQQKVPAAIFVGNGFGKLAGSTQVMELGNLETPVVLTNTLSVATAIQAVVEYTLREKGNEHVYSVNAVVGETNDGSLNDIRGMHVHKEDVWNAITAAKPGPVEEGCVGAGTGTVCFGFKGGIGTASRKLPASLGGYTVGVLVQTNFGGVLAIDGVPVGKELGRFAFSDRLKNPVDGSCMMVVATDAPLDSRNLARLAKRAFMGLARTGGIASNGSGDYVIAFSTNDSLRIPHAPSGPLLHRIELENDAVSPLFMAAIEATEEAIVNSLFAAKTTKGTDQTVPALPMDKVITILKKYNRLK